LRRELSTEVMGATAGFHCDDAGRQGPSELGNAPWPHTPALHHCTILVQPDKAAAVLP
jgi:hypothetical protein